MDIKIHSNQQHGQIDTLRPTAWTNRYTQTNSMDKYIHSDQQHGQIDTLRPTAWTNRYTQTN
ncbi:hypothetical protein CHS0354_000949, partial [Potamilus streckersoni]